MIWILCRAEATSYACSQPLPTSLSSHSSLFSTILISFHILPYSYFNSTSSSGISWPPLHCLSIRMWFYNQFFTLLPRRPPNIQPSSSTKRNLPFWTIFILLYIFLNLLLTSKIYHGDAPLSFLGYLPTIMIFGYIPFYIPPYEQLQFLHTHNNINVLPSLPQQLHSNMDKLAYLSAWHSLHQQQSPRLLHFSPGGKPVCIDTGASCCISNTKEDFLDLTPSSSPVLSGIASSLKIAGTGTICWNISNDAGDEVVLHIHNSLYVPTIPINLLSPQQVCQQTGCPKDGFNVQASSGILHFANHIRTIYYNPTNNLPIFFTTSKLPSQLSPTLPDDSSLTASTTALLSSEDLNTDAPLTYLQRRLLLKHQQLGHLHMARVQVLARSGIFGPSFQSLGTCDPLLCKACLHGKQHRQAVTSTTATGSIDASHLQPGDCISGDQLESSTPGLVATYQGSPSTATYRAGTLLVDHASRYLHFTPHYSTGANEAVQAKLQFELHAKTYHRTIRAYHTDNGVFHSKLFRQSCLSQGQHLQFCGVNAHHQNGIAECYIRTITERARTMLIHSMISWPDIIHENLWPYAIRLAVALHNATPGPSGLSPEELFTGIKHPSRLSDFHPFGCPIFVLDPSLQQGNKIPRWKPRSRVGVYLGPSPEHASTVPLVLSTTTGLVSPQFHVIFDDSFSTVHCLQTNQIPTNWPNLFNESAISFVDEDFSKTNLYDRSWFQHPSQRESTSPILPSTSMNAPIVTTVDVPSSRGRFPMILLLLLLMAGIALILIKQDLKSDFTPTSPLQKNLWIALHPLTLPRFQLF
jgi:hypothetical protein